METEFSENSSINVEAGPPPARAKGSKKKTIEQTYQKLTQLEHVLLRPDTYIGSTQRQQQQLWVHDGERLVSKAIQVSPGLYKIFDEILVNAADNKIRDSSMATLRVDVDEESGSIRVYNDGAGVPVEVHKEHGVYVPELIFGHLLTSSNYDDKEKKVTGGRNGYGAKLANIFSKEFIVETCDGSRKRRYRQASDVFRNNMSDKEEPVIGACPASESWTCITFKPDLERFEMSELEEDTIALFRKRVYDMAGILGKSVKVYYNGKAVPVKDFAAYVDMYLGPKETGPPRFYERINERWEVVVSLSDGQFQQVSFVNSICTSKGGTHVTAVESQVTKSLMELMAKKHKQATVKAHMVKSYLWVFVNCLIENPAFDSQAKETLTLLASGFGSTCPLSDGLLKKVAGSGVVDSILRLASFKADKELKKGDGAKRTRLTGIPKLDDANDAGGRHSAECTLILTEGDSAKTLAISGLSVVGRDRYGVFPLRGKLLNVRDASTSQITGNAEIQNIKQILGLQHGKEYADARSLRYGHLMIMTDQDHDGSHIKGLIMNYFHHFYPSLLRLPGFLVEFITPIIKATKGAQSRTFYTLPEYDTWSASADRRGWRIKYYKGLGTSTAQEAKQYFASLAHHRKRFVWGGAEDGAALEMAFSKKKVEERKDWLRAFVPGTYLDHDAEEIRYSDFVHRELILFSRADLERSIPSVVDGLKPGQRKILFACFKRNLRSDIKVAQLAGYVAEHSAYHHGEASLQSTIVGLAQDFVGSNNVNLLVPQGQFGTRLQGGKDAASARYIFTRLAPLARALFREADDRLLRYLDEEGQSIEPQWYVPVIPTVLINGAEGIGTGWSTSIPNHDPRDVVDNLRRLLADEEPVPMKPWYRGFGGSIEEVPGKTAGKSFLVSGVVRQLDDTTLEITELPIRRWTQDYKEFLEDLLKPEDKNATPFITDYREHHTDATVRFVVTLTEAKMREALAAGLEQKFKLTTRISCGNMMLFNADGVIQRYETPEHILREFFDLRLDFYARRRAALIKAAEADLLRISNKVRFILAVVQGQLVLSNRRRPDIEAQLEAENYDRLPSNAKKAAAAAAADEDDSEEGDAVSQGSYDYLLSMPLASLTHEKVEALQEETEQHKAVVAELHAKTNRQMWAEDLDAFEEAWADLIDEDAHRANVMAKQQAAAQRNARKVAAKKGKGKKANAWSEDEESEADSEDFDDSDEERIPAARAPAPRRAPASRTTSAATTSSAPGRSAGATSGTTSAAAGKVRAAAAKAPAASKKASAAEPLAPTTTSSLLPPDQASSHAPEVVDIAQEEEELSLMARMAQRMGDLAVASRTGSPRSEALGPTSFAGAFGDLPAAAPAAKPARGAAATTARARKPKRPSAPNSEDEAAWSSGPEAQASRASFRADSKKQPSSSSNSLGTKRKPAKARAGAMARVESEAAISTDEVGSPAPAKPKVPRMRPSPFHKGSGLSKPAPGPSGLGKPPRPAAKKATGKKPALDSEEDEEAALSDDSDVVEEAPKARAPTARRAAASRAPAKYVEESSEDEVSPEEEDDADSDEYVPSD